MHKPCSGDGVISSDYALTKHSHVNDVVYHFEMNAWIGVLCPFFPENVPFNLRLISCVSDSAISIYIESKLYSNIRV